MNWIVLTEFGFLLPNVVGERVSCDDEANNVADLEATVRGEVRNRSLSLSLAPQYPVILVAGAAVNTQHAAVDDADPGDIGCPGGSGNDVAEWKTSQAQLCTGADDAEDEADDGCDGALKAPRSNLCCALEEREEVGSEIAAVGYEAEDTQTCFGGKSNDGGGEAGGVVRSRWRARAVARIPVPAPDQRQACKRAHSLVKHNPG
ncbi:hypothetical protein VaNZ11_004358 [Volvox africanus]|uniref:Uncharacterized protein n=1 Tax=Volvox africanus TaxID=51714 RepID=A0ABQ5RWE0_9CHLO|nr:hypothetical protein VaNZ11_004358 [Volvox africanus]